MPSYLKKTTFELEPEQADAIVVAELKQQLEWFDRDHSCRSGSIGPAIFDDDPAADVKIIEQHMDAIKMILSWYGYQPGVE